MEPEGSQTEGDGLASLAVKMEEEATGSLQMDIPRVSRTNTALLPPARAMSDSDFQNERLDMCLKPQSL